MAWRGKYNPQNPQKYIGDITNIIYRSGLEWRVMRWLDLQESILAWASEEIAIPYCDPTNNKARRYFPDFWVRMKKKDGSIIEELWEVKPKNQKVSW